jgi:glycosyltransferase involved in cell wall biosynthesis
MQQESNRTTVVVITHNYGRYLRRAVESAIAQTRRPRVLVMDDASEDDTEALVRQMRLEYSNAFDCFRSATNEGLSEMRNMAARLVATHWVVFLDADDWLAGDFIEKGEQWLDQHPETDALTTDMLIVSNGGNLRVRKARVPRTWCDLRRSNSVVQTSFIKRERILELGGYDGRLHFEDWDFWIRLLKAGGTIGRLPGEHVFWREHGSNKSKTCDETFATRQVREKHPSEPAWRRRGK